VVTLLTNLCQFHSTEQCVFFAARVAWLHLLTADKSEMYFTGDRGFHSPDKTKQEGQLLL